MKTRRIAPMVNPIQIVLLDADGVIQSTLARRIRVFDLASGDSKRTDKFLTEIFEEEHPCLTSQGEFPSKLNEILDRWGNHITLEQCLSAWTAIEPNQEILQLVAEVRANGMLVGVASSQESYRASYMSTTLGYKQAFDHEFYSCDIGFVKPDKEYFYAVLRKLNLRPDNVLFLDDNQPIVDAASDCGLTAFHFDLKQHTVDNMRNIFTAHGLI